MKIEEFLDSFHKAEIDGCEFAKSNLDQISDEIESKISLVELITLMTDLRQMGELIKISDDLHIPILMFTQIVLRNQNAILKMLELPEFEVEFR